MPVCVKPQEIAEVIKYRATVEGVVTPKPCVTFLLGAGFSRSAGIPAAGTIVEEYLKPHPLLKGKPGPPPGTSAYAHYMGQLQPIDRRKIIQQCVDKARDTDTKRVRINWAHLLLATMVNAGYVKQILTTNFDPLIPDALAVTGQPVRVFDLAASDQFLAGALDPGSVVYLHGQACGLLLSNATGETEKVRKHVNAVFQDALSDSMLIVVGYSGDCDPVLEELVDRFPQFSHGLYWVHYPGDTQPGAKALKLIEDEARGASLVTDYDADRFMQALVLEGLKLKLPMIVEDPLAFAKEGLARIMPFPADDSVPPSRDPVERAKERVTEGLALLLSPPSAREPEKTQVKVPARPKEDASQLAIAIAMAAAAKDKVKIEELRKEIEATDSLDLRYAVGDAYLGLVRSALGETRLDQAQEFLNMAREIGVSQPQWLFLLQGVLLFEQAEGKQGPESEQLFDAACYAYADALEADPGMYQALNNWGLALCKLAERKEGLKAESIAREACSKFEATVKIKPDDHEAYYNWGLTLHKMAEDEEGSDAEVLFLEACSKYEEAQRIRPDKHEALYNWGLVLYRVAEKKEGREAESLLLEACAKFEETARLKPDKFEALYNWGVALCRLAESKEGPIAELLLQDACTKYEVANRIKPDDDEALFNWALALYRLAQMKEGLEARLLLQTACVKYKEALSVKPNSYIAFYNWGNALRALAERSESPEAESLLLQACAKYEEALSAKPDNHEALCNWGAALHLMAEKKEGGEAESLLKEASARYEEALRTKPDSHDALYNWGLALFKMARQKNGTEAEELFREASAKCEEALSVKPNMREALLCMACVHAVRGKVDEAIAVMRRWADTTPRPSRDMIDKDKDFDGIRENPNFEAFLATLPPGP